MIRYFAYGSNMLSRRLQRRTASAQPLGPALLSGYRLVFTKPGSRCGSGKCGIVIDQAATACVHGVLFTLDHRELELLDRFEGVGYGYQRGEVTVRPDDDSPSLTAMTYLPTRLDPDVLPFDWYRDLVIAGAREHGLPASYIADLSAVAAKPDEDRARATAHRALIPSRSAAV